GRRADERPLQQILQASLSRQIDAATKSGREQRSCRANFLHRGQASAGKYKRGLAMNRRSFVKWASAFPLLAQVGLEQAMGTGWAEVARNSTDNIYTRLGV